MGDAPPEMQRHMRSPHPAMERMMDSPALRPMMQSG